MSGALESNFETVVGIIREGLATGNQTQYFPSLVAIDNESIRINCLFRGLPEAEILQAVERFGYKTGRRKHVPEFLFFSAESISTDANDQIMVSGCSKRFETIVGYLMCSRSPAGGLVPGVVSGVGYPTVHELERVPAWQAMNSAIAKSKTAWWRL